MCPMIEGRASGVGKKEPHPGDAFYGMLTYITWKVFGATIGFKAEKCQNWIYLVEKNHSNYSMENILNI